MIRSEAEYISMLEKHGFRDVVASRLREPRKWRGGSAGIIAALRRGSRLDRFISASAGIGLAIPSFVASIFLLRWFALSHRWFPAGGFVPFTSNPVLWFKHLVLPESYQRTTLKTIRHHLLNLAGKIVHTARRCFLMLSDQYRYQTVWRFAIARLAHLQFG